MTAVAEVVGLRVTVIGLGHVGTVAAVCLAHMGHDVTGVDTDHERIRYLGSGEIPFCEPGLLEMMEEAIALERLRFSHSSDCVEPLGKVALVATGTPPGADGAVDLRQVKSALAWVKERWSAKTTVVMKSTVPPGTGQRLLAGDMRQLRASYVANPEFLREGMAIHDWQRPDRIIVGTGRGNTAAVDSIREMYGTTDATWMITDTTSAEMVKYASNAMLAARISFMNEIAALCEQVGASIDDVSEGVAMDPRTGDRIYAGVGYGGSCFPKDVGALDHLAMTTGVDAEILRAVIAVNQRQRLLPLRAIRARFGGAVSGLRMAVLGLAFKPGTDDVREAPALELIRVLSGDGVSVVAYDPEAAKNARPYLPSSVELAKDPVSATRGVQAVFLMTEWESIVGADWETISRVMLSPRLLFDGRNALDQAQMMRLGFEYVGVGRPSTPDFGSSGSRSPDEEDSSAS